MSIFKWNGRVIQADLTKYDQRLTSALTKINGQTISLPSIPAGLIVPIRAAASVPTDWTLWSDADDYYIVGAGSTYSVGSSSSGTGSIACTDTAAGTHTVAGNNFGRNSSDCGTSADPNHQHTTWTASGLEPDYAKFRLVQADTYISTLPQDLTVFNASTGGSTGATQHQPTNDSIFGAASAAAESNGKSVAITSSTDNDHNHGGVSGDTPSGSNGSAYKGYSKITSHAHTVTLAFSLNLYRVALSAWYHATGNLTMQSGMIAMWEGATAPSGWSLCDGTGGTPDLRDYFVEIPNLDASSGTVSGDGTVSASAVTSSSNGSHNHQSGGTCNDCPRETAYHASSGGAHTHDVSYSSGTWLPPYYALTFIQKD
jgi:hypothetical protein